MNKSDLPGLTWRKATKSDMSGGNCVEVAKDGDRYYVTDSKDTNSPVLTFTKGEWDAFQDGVVKGEFA